MSNKRPADAELTASAARLATKAGLAGEVELTPLPGGKNNRAYAMAVGNSQYFLKSYFRHKDDPRDRLGAEYALVQYAWGLGVRCVAQPLACDTAAGMALYSFLEGSRPEKGAVQTDYVRQAAQFYQMLNPADKGTPPLADGSEACFSFSEHLACVDRRVERLSTAADTGNMRDDAAQFTVETLKPVWQGLKRHLIDEVRNIDIDPNWVLPMNLRRVSPSDFGFHNALVRQDGQLAFLDFEYAGLDDPAKMICDFFCQPEIPAPMETWQIFLDCICEVSGEDEHLTRRAKLLLPAYRIKWCCIMLNDFLPVGGARRDFAECGEASDRCDRQLAHVMEYLKNTELPSNG